MEGKILGFQFELVFAKPICPSYKFQNLKLAYYIVINEIC